MDLPTAPVNAPPPAEGIDTAPPPPPPVDSEGKITVAPDKMRAFLNISMPKNGGNNLSLGQIRDLINAAGVTFGLRDSSVESMAVNPLYSRDVAIAEGVPPVKGKDGELTYKVKLTRDSSPVVREDGTLDYKSLGLIESVEKDAVLCVKTPAEDGTDGTTVLGGVIPAQRGKDVPLPFGKGTYITDDGLELRAKVSGQCDMRDRKLVVEETYVVKGDVCFETGNINFIGNVTVQGSVISGFSVKADGNVTIQGTVEEAKVESGGNVIVQGGFQGGNKGEIRAVGMVRCKYIQYGNVYAGGNVETQVIVLSRIQSGDSVVLQGSRSTIMGGRVTAKNRVECDVIGNPVNPIPTLIEVGSDPRLNDRYLDIQKELLALKKQQDSVGQIVASFELFEKRGALSEERSEMLIRSRATYRTNAEVMLAHMQELEEIRLKLAQEGYGSIIARQSLNPGATVTIGPEKQVISQSVSNVMIVRGEDGLYTSVPSARKK